MKTRIGEQLLDFVGKGNLVLGICNGFQVLVNLEHRPLPMRLNGEVTVDHDGTIYAAVIELYEKREPVDIVTVSEVLERNVRCHEHAERPGLTNAPGDELSVLRPEVGPIGWPVVCPERTQIRGDRRAHLRRQE